MNNIINYYDNILSEFVPYKDLPLYQIFITLIKETYIKNSFNDDIIDLTNINNCILDDKHINSTLIINGFDNGLINKIPKIDKIKIILKCVDVNSYKGSILCYQKILDAFDYNIDLYNLYLMNKTENIFHPKLLCSQSNLSQKQLSLTTGITITENVNFLISNNSQSIYENTIFPLKTNLILLNNLIYTSENIMNLYIGCGILNHYSDYDILLKLDYDKIYKTDIKKTFLILHYLHNYHTSNNTTISSVISQDNILFDFNIDDISNIDSYVNNVVSNSTLVDFLNTYITPLYSEYTTNIVNYNTQLSTIKSYLDDYDDKTILIENILDSLNLWLDSIDIVHSKYLLNLIPMYKKYIKISTPYKLLNYFKHISNQFVIKDSVIITINNKLSNIYIDEMIEIKR